MQNRWWLGAGLVAATIGWAVPPAGADPVFHGVQGIGRNLVEIDVGRRTVTTVGPTDVLQLDDLARDPFGNLVALASEGELVQYTVAYFLDETSGAATRLATFDVNSRNLAFDADAGHFLAMPNFPPDLGVMDPATGVFTTLVGPHTIQMPAQLTAITLAGDGTMYGAHQLWGTANYELMVIDRTTLRATVIGPMGDGSDGSPSGTPQFPVVALSVESLAFDPETGILYTVNWQNGDIYTVDTQTGAGSFLFAGGEAARRITGLVYSGRSDATACPCELDGDPAVVNVFDLLAYLSLWFTQDPAADLDDDPTVINVFDLLVYLDCWFEAVDAGACP